MDRTEHQGGAEHERAKELSLRGARPPTEVPGYDTQRFLGAGAYGEVWVALDRNTGRRVAIKFYTHRGGLDWSLLSREVEKLAYLSADRYVVQLLDVGWESDPPYYVMEYIEHGSLADKLDAEGALPVDEAVSLFREIAIGLSHAHNKGVFHCDLKPANVLLDQDASPRLADFGQSRLSHEQTPALGTLFFMAPEQADTKAVPDARWDVYALGAILCNMLTGDPPHRNDSNVSEIESGHDLEDRLARYRKAIHQTGKPTEYRKRRDIDRELIDILDRCLDPDPKNRFPNVQALLDAMTVRDGRRARRPLVLLGAVGPALLLIVMGLVAWRWFDTIVHESNESLTARTLQNNEFAAKFVAREAGNELETRYRAAEQVAVLDRSFHTLLRQVLADEPLAELRRQLSDPTRTEAELEPLREEFRAHPALQPLQRRMEEIYADNDNLKIASWFVNDPQGLQIARSARSHTIGRNYAWRTYFSGWPSDHAPDWRPVPDDHIVETHLSAVFLSQASDKWIVAISSPIYDLDPTAEDKFLGVLALTVEVGGFVELQELADVTEPFAVLVDWRDGANKGLIVQHPLYDQMRDRGESVQTVVGARLDEASLPQGDRRKQYRDPVAEFEPGAAYRGIWLAEVSEVRVRDRPTGWRVVVQQSYQGAIGAALAKLKSSLLTSGLIALLLMATVITLLWILVLKLLNRTTGGAAGSGRSGSVTPTETMATLPNFQQPSRNK
ncbi:MAG: serine/threonine protein kinase [Pirellulales bacterium]